MDYEIDIIEPVVTEEEYSFICEHYSHTITRRTITDNMMFGSSEIKSTCNNCGQLE